MRKERYYLTEKQLYLLDKEMERKKKREWIAYLVWIFTGLIGGHRYYLGHKTMGVLMTLTLGGLGVVTLLDVFNIKELVQKENYKLESKLIRKLNLYEKGNV